MPKHEGLTRELAQKTEDFVLTFLLPIFFAYSGLRTSGWLAQPSDFVGAVRAGVDRGDRGQIFRHLYCGQSLRHRQTRILCLGLVDEHSRANRANRAEYWLKFGRDFAFAVHHAGDYGARHHLYDFTLARTPPTPNSKFAKIAPSLP